ncbi:hypothetical protein A5687_21325 [Mycobacterium mantenii]|nr:hypothetical protein A5687_21325 [Mycobacterium mantenii]
MWRANPRCYGRLYMAAILSHPVRHPDDADNLPDLVETGLSMGGYHVRLELLQAAQFGCRILKSEVRQRMIDVLEDYTPATGDWGTNTMLIEALASYGAITPMTNLENIQDSIAEILSAPEDPDQCRLARGIVSKMFEDERVLGPYSEAVDSLSDDHRHTLFAMSALAPDIDFSFSTAYVMRHLADGVRSHDGIVARALAQGAGTAPDDDMMRQEVVAAHLHALRGWAKIAATLPPATNPTGRAATAWRLVDELLLALFRDGNAADRAEEIWQRLITGLPADATAVLNDIYHAMLVNYPGQDHFSPHQALLAAYPEQVRQVLEWALTHRDEFSGPKWRGVWDVGTYVVRALGQVGTAETADLLRYHYIQDAELGDEAVAAVHAIDARTQA